MTDALWYLGRGTGVVALLLLTLVVLLGIHVTTLLADPYAQLRVVDLFVPFAGRYRPLWTGLGTVGLDLIVALVATSLLRYRLGQRAWRTVHWLAYLCWPVAVLHSLGTGSDAGEFWLRAVAVLCVGSVVGCLCWRIGERFGTPSTLDGVR